MCNQLEIIARATGTTRYIARCGHGTLHVVWHNAAFYLNRDGLTELREMLDGAQTMQRVRSWVSRSKEPGAANDANLQFVEVWFQDAGLGVRPEDFEWMQKMVNEAISFLENEPLYSDTAPLIDTTSPLRQFREADNHAQWN